MYFLNVASLLTQSPRSRPVWQADPTGLPECRFVRRAWLPFPGQARNVLLVMLEGSVALFALLHPNAQWQRDIEMSRLDAHTPSRVAFHRFLTQQRQTNRGTYSVLCGDIPKLVISIPRMSAIANHGNRPATYRPHEAGYNSWQAAPLSFMQRMCSCRWQDLHR
ncbi:hypothetical protein DSL92_06285 [Billgrantia gudaonensis]|uniref:Uncharacterized protein n=1 Tax=Billgrantia gudaonensis TaxID=376427 RepID=A0A3S0QRP5_9GAMM|nr:hypothetical protein DSL92_06285 [Halomonas gudaonensis]